MQNIPLSWTEHSQSAYTSQILSTNSAQTFLFLGGGRGFLLQHYVRTQPLLPTINDRLRNLIDFPLTAYCELLTKRRTQLHSVAEKELWQLVINALHILYSEVRNNAN